MQDQQHITAFVDESGNHDLDVSKDGASALFICVAVVVQDSDIDRANEAVIRIQKDRFGGTEIKSSGIGGNHDRRLKVLKTLESIPFGYYATICNKAEIEKDSGLRYKPSFYKFMNQLLYERLLRGVPSLHIVADEHGRPEFMASFDKYLKNKNPDMELFDSSQVMPWYQVFRDSSETPLIQIADLIAGTLTWCYDPQRDCGEYREKFLSILQPTRMSVEVWPRKVRPVPDILPSSPNELDSYIRTICENVAVRFINDFGDNPDQDRQMQVATLRHMLLLSKHETGDRRARHGAALIEHLAWQGFQDITERKFRQAVIGPLRDSGIIIAGDSSGYRLAMSDDDIGRYVNHDRSIIEPMLARLQKGRATLKGATVNRFDVLDHPEFTIIRELSETFGTVSVAHEIAKPSEELDGIE